MHDNAESKGKLIGYARVSTSEQSVSMQITALRHAGVAEEWIFSESASGSKKSLPALKQALHATSAGDTLVVWKLDRIARSLTHLLELIEGLEKKGVAFRSLTEGVETQTPAGKLILHVLGALAQFERDLIRERSRAGVAAARERGVRFGADFKLPEDQMPRVWSLVREQGKRQVDVAREYNVAPNTIARRLKDYEAILPKQTQRARQKRK